MALNPFSISSFLFGQTPANADVSVNKQRGGDMAWTMGSGKAMRTLGWILPTLAALIAPSMAQQTTTNLPERVKRQVVISVPDRKLVVMESGAVLRVFSVAVGADVSPSPTGELEIVTRLTDPTYYHSGVVIPAGTDNPLGPRWVGLNKKGYGIHGTNMPGSIGKAASHGCIRMRNRDIVQFFALVSVGDTVEIHGQRDEEIAEIFGGEADENAIALAHNASTGSAGGQ
jgi:lipoprotein-anchoring transpeptidase ErfK/SrfK